MIQIAKSVTRKIKLSETNRKKRNKANNYSLNTKGIAKGNTKLTFSKLAKLGEKLQPSPNEPRRITYFFEV